MDPILKDKRFAHVARDPRFRKMPVAERKVKIDKRFKHMFEDKKFKMKYSVDKRGRPVNLSTNENLKKYYEMSDDEGSSDDDDDDNDDLNEMDDDKQNLNKMEKVDKNKQKNKKGDEIKKGKRFERAVANDSDESDSDLESDDDSDEPLTADSGVDFARGEGNVVSSSSESSDSESEGEEEDKRDLSKIDHKWNEKDDNVLEMSEATHRLAICNMDWDRVKAQDIYMVLNSFTPANGVIRSVKIYPSEFGKERMAEEERQGPRELTEVKLASDEESEGEDDDVMVDNEGTKYHMEKLREYQMKRLRYYYAVMECDTPATADAIYKECDGMEYETSSTKLDLRFIPDDTDFDDSEATSTCTGAPAGYKPVYFANAALSQSKVELTWDETDRDRVQRTQAQFETNRKGGKGAAEEGEEDDLRAYLASSSDEDELHSDDGDVPIKDRSRSQDPGSDESEDSDNENEDKRINKYKQLLLEADSQEKSKHNTDVSMEITWEPGLRETTESLVKKKKKQGGKASVWEEYLEKKKEKKRKKIEERKQKKLQQKQQAEESSEESGEENGTAGQDVEGEQAFSDDDLPAGVDINDPFFTDLSDTSGQKKKKKDKKKKKKKTDVDDNEDTQEKAELSLLMLDNDNDNKKHFNYADIVETEDGKKGKKKKKKKGKQTNTNTTAQGTEDFQVDVADPRFSAVYESHLFNIDPSAPEYKKTKGTDAIIDEKLKRSASDKRDKSKKKKKRLNSDDNVNAGDGIVKKAKVGMPEKPQQESLASLIKSVKAKTKHFQSAKNKH